MIKCQSLHTQKARARFEDDPRNIRAPCETTLGQSFDLLPDQNFTRLSEIAFDRDTLEIENEISTDLEMFVSICNPNIPDVRPSQSRTGEFLN
jgi:hypothetical protein